MKHEYANTPNPPRSERDLPLTDCLLFNRALAVRVPCGDYISVDTCSCYIASSALPFPLRPPSFCKSLKNLPALLGTSGLPPHPQNTIFHDFSNKICIIMASPNSFSRIGHQAWEAQMGRASQSPHLNPTQTPRCYITTAGLLPPYACPSTRNPWLPASNNASSSRAPSMTSDEAPSPSQCISAHTPTQSAFADTQPIIDGNARDGVSYGADNSYRQLDLRGK